MDLQADIKRIERKLDQLLKQQPKPTKTWVKASVITKITIWDSGEKMREARERGYVLHRTVGTGKGKKIRKNIYEYLLESISTTFLKQKTLTATNS